MPGFIHRLFGKDSNEGSEGLVGGETTIYVFVTHVHATTAVQHMLPRVATGCKHDER